LVQSDVLIRGPLPLLGGCG